MIPNLNKVKLPFLEREKCAIPEIEFRCLSLDTVWGLVLWTSCLPFAPNPFNLKNGILVDVFEKMEKLFSFRKIPIGKIGLLQFYKEVMIVSWFYRSRTYVVVFWNL